MVDVRYHVRRGTWNVNVNVEVDGVNEGTGAEVKKNVSLERLSSYQTAEARS